MPAGNRKEGSSKRILVVGGGMSGMTAALEVAETGYEVVLVEKTGALGGMAAQLWKRVPFKEPYAAAQDTGVAELVAKIAATPLIKVHLNSTIAETSGAPGRFAVQIAQESGAVSEETVGAIVQATGFTPYDMAKLPELGGGQPNVVDQAGLEALARAANGGAIKRADGKEVKSVVFVQCAGQRDDTGHAPVLLLRPLLRHQHQAGDVLQGCQPRRRHGGDVPGPAHARHGRGLLPQRAENGRDLHQGQGVARSPAATAVQVTFQDLILDEETAIAADLVVLATGQVPNSGVDIEAWNPVVTAAEGGDEAAKAQRVVMHGISVLNLTTARARTCRSSSTASPTRTSSASPTRRAAPASTPPVRCAGRWTSLQATEDATGAALKAIQAVENAAVGRAAHPRSGDLSFPTVRLEGCTQCKRCTVECPFGAIDEDEKRFPVFNESRCRRCGTCMGACPVRVISFENYSVRYRRQPDQGGRDSRRVRGEAAHPDAGLRERRLPGARHGRHGAHRPTRPSCASSRCAASARSTPSGSPTR